MANTSTQVTPDRVLQQMIMGFRLTQLLHVAAKLGIADELAQGPKSARELAAACKCDPDALYRTLRALAHVGVLVEQNQQRFKLTPMGEYLREGVRGSLRGTAIMFGEPWLWNGYGQLLHSAQTGKAAFEHAHEKSITDYLRDHEDAAQLLDQADRASAEQEMAGLLRACDFTGVSSVIDIGGGKGSLLRELLSKYPKLQGTLFDLPHVVENADAALKTGELASRCTLSGGDMFEHVPAGGEVYLMKHVVRDLDDERAAQLLKKCREAMSPDARLVLFERLVAEPNESSETKLLDIDALAMFGGRLRTEYEHQALLDTAGLRLTHFRTTRGPLSILEAMPL
ncbi:MAG TPA: methyltransferase [Polyangiales bacterium]|jgi:hypothetical protein|nr:methyltransferase [Polyangiales bacterium]